MILLAALAFGKDLDCPVGTREERDGRYRYCRYAYCLSQGECLAGQVCVEAEVCSLPTTTPAGRETQISTGLCPPTKQCEGLASCITKPVCLDVDVADAVNEPAKATSWLCSTTGSMGSGLFLLAMLGMRKR